MASVTTGPFDFYESGVFPLSPRPALVPLTAREAPKGDQTDQRHDQARPKAPHEHQDDADDDEDSSK